MRKAFVIGIVVVMALGIGIYLFLPKEKDQDPPTLILKGNDTITLIKGNKYEESGYEASDEKDGNLTYKVKVIGTVDTEKTGTYILTYVVEDKAHHKVERTRTIQVIDDSPLKISVKEFTLDGYFPNTILKETEDYGDEYIDEFIFAGDSMALYYVINKLVPGTRLWHQVSIDPETALTNPIYINHQETGKTFIQNLKEKQPSKVLFTLGTNGAAYMQVDYFIDCYRKLLIEMKEASPDTLLIIQSIPPIDRKYDTKENGITNQKINTLNYYIASLCDELKIPFLNSASAMKGEDGTCKDGYCISKDGIHPTVQGQTALIQYMKTHGYGKET